MCEAFICEILNMVKIQVDRKSTGSVIQWIKIQWNFSYTENRFRKYCFLAEHSKDTQRVYLR